MYGIKILQNQGFVSYFIKLLISHWLSLYRLRDLNSCITAGKSRQTRLFDYLRQDVNNVYSGKTVFTKLRLNVTTMQVLSKYTQLQYNSLELIIVFLVRTGWKITWKLLLIRK